MTYCTAEDVRRAVDFPATGAPIDDTDIDEFILDSQDEIEFIYKTKFGHIETTNTATSATASSLTTTGAGLTADDHQDKVLKITSGTGSGQYRSIVSNTTDTYTITPNWTTTPDNTSTYNVQTLGYKSKVVDGDGKDEQFVEEYPLIDLLALTIDSTTITISSVYTYESGKVLLGQSSEQTYFNNSFPQLVEWEYIYGVEPFPRIIKRLCVILSSLRTLSAQIAGTYDDFTSITLPGITGSKGEPFTNIRESIAKLQSEAKAIIGDVDQGTQLEAKGWHSYRPFSQFG